MSSDDNARRIGLATTEHSRSDRALIGRDVFTDSTAPLLGYAPMDMRHKEFVATLSRLRAAGPGTVTADLDAMLQHLTEHFEEERRWMEESSFPATQCHVDEHSAVLRSASTLRTHLESHADLAEVQRFATALSDWFPGHADYMDAALSHWLSKRTYGGAPIVLRRHAATPA